VAIWVGSQIAKLTLDRLMSFQMQTYSFAVVGPRPDGQNHGNIYGLPDDLYAKSTLENPNPAM
jgi:hypothetical protein